MTDHEWTFKTRDGLHAKILESAVRLSPVLLSMTEKTNPMFSILIENMDGFTLDLLCAWSRHHAPKTKPTRPHEKITRTDSAWFQKLRMDQLKDLIEASTMLQHKLLKEGCQDELERREHEANPVALKKGQVHFLDEKKKKKK